MHAAIWYAVRSSGLLAYLFLSAAAVLGIVLSRRVSTQWPRFAVEEVHRFVAILAGVFIAIHGFAIAVDTFVPHSPADLVVPFAWSYHRFATGLGVIAGELLAAVGLTNLLRKRIGFRRWRKAHYLTFPAWTAATLHGMLVGTDRAQGWFMLLYLGAFGAVFVAVLARLPAPPRAAQTR
jgi:sulfoxide reductase heme-binding subunit YedZ